MVFLSVIVIIELIFKPRLDFSDYLILWYGRKNRTYIILFKL